MSASQKIEIERLAVAFRNAPNSPNHAATDTWNAIAKIGGHTAILYGRYLATPLRQRWKKYDLGLTIAAALDAEAAK